MTVIVTHAHFSHPPAVVFEYVTTPANWPKWHPSSLKVEGPGADHPALVGEEVVEQFHVSGRRGEVTWRVVERDEPHYWRIDGVVTGRSNGGTVSYRLTPSLEELISLGLSRIPHRDFCSLWPIGYSFAGE